jgi:hypothetical protein
LDNSQHPLIAPAGFAWTARLEGKSGLWNTCTDEELHTRYGLYALPTTAAWKAVR